MYKSFLTLEKKKKQKWDEKFYNILFGNFIISLEFLPKNKFMIAAIFDCFKKSILTSEKILIFEKFTIKIDKKYDLI